MRRRALGTALSVVTLATAAGISGCTRDAATGPAPQTSIAGTDGFGPTAPTRVDTGPLPPPEALSDVISRLADPAVPGKDKLGLVENTNQADDAALDTFATALRNTGFSPVAVRASDIVASGSGTVVATITMTGPESGSGGGEFSFPMEFRRAGDSWQLTRQTADMLLAFGNARTAAPTPPPPPAPTPPR